MEYPSIKQFLANTSVYPVLGKALTLENTAQLDFSPSNERLRTVDLSNTEAFNFFVFDELRKQGKAFGIGGYFEHRAIYSRSQVFATAAEDFRDIHMGIDIWAAPLTPLFAPLDGVIHSFQDNAGFGNYGPTIILEHEINDQKLYTLYGHLCLEDLRDIHTGQVIKAGEKIAHIGPFPENGDWPPHLHFQLMWDMMGNWGDFPGVCSHREQEKFQAICPDPAYLIPFLI
ncbi:peptidoglycan DD-metalloendopeptidase family protein [Mongoliitalea daihaiensis]|uniref:peptidoglycan DD-metalloendopeptidase family protein n=1 Tax=Mongoliitalea daihaiensis TaxID=2782006 RepID=UPI001F459E3F|nr:peptidoglycan DD-metalloendopeptidase family protein [Mongoliitalea daihaiensis]UJP66118.1 peptidoglycan DD-metalloendopeptidase family protein [Mongoliitalea daihaiensis]